MTHGPSSNVVRVGATVVGLAAVATLSGAAATHATPKHQTRPLAPAEVHAAALPQLPLTPEMLSRGAPADAKLLPRKPVHAAHPAPATHPVISGLAANGIPTIALNAYRVAAARMASADPGCGIQWPLLAAIGRVESDHGRYGGALLYADGTSLPRIIGIPLDGSRSAYIGDTDGGTLDGDARYDHAVGPMQFIPNTWASWGVDGNGDGVASPFNVNDAALAAARYLCASGGDLRTHAGQVAAVLAYNDSDQYLAQVLALALAYAHGVRVDDVPITGPTTGGLPPASPWGGAPVNPAVPSAGTPPGAVPPAARAHATPPKTTAAPGGAHSSAPTGALSGPVSSGHNGGGNSGAGGGSDGGGGNGGSGGSTGNHPGTPTPTPTPTHSPGPGGTPTPTPTPNPLQTVINGVLCTLSLLGIPICPPS
jgi:membrane-bound lytic murein transglycosylase B